MKEVALFNLLLSLSGSKKIVSAKKLKDVKGGEGTHALYQDIFYLQPD